MSPCTKGTLSVTLHHSVPLVLSSRLLFVPPIGHPDLCPMAGHSLHLSPLPLSLAGEVVLSSSFMCQFENDCLSEVLPETQVLLFHVPTAPQVSRCGLLVTLCL